MNPNMKVLSQIDQISKALLSVKELFANADPAADEQFNEMITLFLSLNNELEGMNNRNINYYLNRIADNMVKIIEDINHSGRFQGTDYDYLITLVAYLHNFLLSSGKKNIIVIAATEFSLFLKEVINFNKINILAYVLPDNRSLISGELAIGIEDIHCFDADFYLSDIEISGIEQSKMIEYGTFLKYSCFQSPEFMLRYSDFLECPKDYEGIITGISYTQLAIDEKRLHKKFVNLANPTQDLFYDFKMFQLGMKYNENAWNIKYCILGLCLYSFHYDLSRSKANEARSIYYYPVVNTMHHYWDKENHERYYKDFSQKAEQVFKFDFYLTIFDKYKQSYRNILKEGRTEEFDSAGLTAEQVDEKTEYIKKEFHKYYPETREENIKIFREYLQVLKNNNIRTVVVIPPLSKFYEERIPAKLREETLEIIQNAGNEYNFTFLDFSDNTLFDDKFFTDGAHLNEKGAEKFTDIVNQYI